jgi:hypothetical protein
MEIQGTVESTEMEFTVEVDTDEVWRDIEDQVNEVAYEQGREAAREEIQHGAIDVDFTQGAIDLLEDYNPGTGCELARLFERAVQSAVTVNDFLKDVVLEQVGEHRDGNPQTAGLSEDAVREIVRTEIRHALADASSGVRERQLAAPTA